jgi:thioredoxin-related protein
MKRLLSLVLISLSMLGTAYAGGADNKAEGGVKWMSLDEAQAAMQREPKKVLIDMYTDWCGWCKVMDRKTFSNPEVAAYINKNFYAVKFNAESRDSVRFGGRMWGISEGNRANDLAVELLKGQLSYPTTVIMEAGFQNPQPVPGYLDVPTMEVILHYLGEDVYKQKVPFVEYQKDYKHQWTAAKEEKQPANAGH